MAEPPRGMGRGLAAILSVPDADPDADQLRSLPVRAISANPDQPRRSIEEEPLADLAGSLRERGVLQPVLVRPAEPGRYQLIAGERRWRAAQLAGLETIPAIVRSADDGASLELALIENMAREDLNPVDQARACAALVEELGLTREAVGARVGRSRVAISNLLRLLDLPDEALAFLESGELTEGHGRALLLAGDHEGRRRLARAAAEHGWSVRQLEDRARQSTTGSRTRPRADRARHPDEEEAMSALAESLGALLGRDVSVRPRGERYRVQFEVDSLDAASALVERLEDGSPRPP